MCRVERTGPSRALEELRGEAECGRRGRAALGWLGGHGTEFGLYPTRSIWELSKRTLVVETFCDFMTLVQASFASVCRLSILPPPRVSVFPITHTVAHRQIDGKLAVQPSGQGAP